MLQMAPRYHQDLGLKKKKNHPILLRIFYQNKEKISFLAYVCKVCCSEVKEACMPASKSALCISLGFLHNQEHSIFPFLLPFTSQIKSVRTPLESSGGEASKPHSPLSTHQSPTLKFSSNLFLFLICF